MKSVNEIITHGTFSFWDVFISQPFFFLFLDVIFIGIIAFLYIRWTKKREEYPIPKRMMKKFLLMVYSGVFLSIGFGLCVWNHMKLEEDWKETYVTPYLDSLEEKEIDIANIQKGSDYIILTSEDEHIKDLKLKIGEFKTSETNSLHPKIKYVKLEEDLGNGFTKGIYNIHLYLPANYKIEDVSS